MSGRWQYKVIEVRPKLFAGSLTSREQSELDSLGLLGWELVAAVQSAPMDTVRLYLKKEA